MAKKKAPARAAPKLGIYLPDYRVADLEKWRGEMNLSEIFWSAFDRERVRLASLKMEESSMKAMLERLRKEGSEEKDRGLKDGRMEGATFARDVGSLAQIRDIADGDLTFDDTETALVDWFVEIGHGGEHRDWEDHQPELLKSGPYTDGYTEGFIEAVTAAWNEVKDQL